MWACEWCPIAFRAFTIRVRAVSSGAGLVGSRTVMFWFGVGGVVCPLHRLSLVDMGCSGS